MHATDQFVDNLRGTVQAPIWIGGEPGQPRPVIAGGSGPLQLAQAAYVVVHDLEIRGQTGNGLNIDDGGQFSVETAAHHIAVVRLHVHDLGGTGNNDCIKVSGIQAKGGSTDVDVRDNRMRISGQRAVNLGGSTDLTLFRPPLSLTATNAEARRIRVFNNIITGLGTTATPFAFVGCIDCFAAHNLALGQQRWHMRILQETPTQAGSRSNPRRTGG